MSTRQERSAPFKPPQHTGKHLLDVLLGPCDVLGISYEFEQVIVTDKVEAGEGRSRQ